MRPGLQGAPPATLPFLTLKVGPPETEIKPSASEQVEGDPDFLTSSAPEGNLD